MTAHYRTAKPLPEALPNPFWLLPAGALVGSAWFIFNMESGALLQHAFIGAMWGAFDAVPVVIVAAFILIGLHSRRARAQWKAHSFQWYRSSYPDHTHEPGEVSCCHCGAQQLQVRNIPGHADVRTRACGQCGEMLFFLRE
jgi:hypothetical protein